MSCKNRMSAAETEAMIRGSDDDQPVYLRAGERNESEVYRREMKRRQATVEGVFASLDRLGWARYKLRGLWKVDCEGYISALAHNLKKAVRKLGGMGPPTPAAAVAASR